MIPEFNEDGILPPGIHLCTIEEFETRFVTNFRRQQLYNGLLKLMKDLKKNIGCKIIYIDGSFVTSKQNPNDIDVCWDEEGVNFDLIESQMPVLLELDAPRTLQQNLYSCDIFPAFIEEGISGRMFIDFFQYDKSTGSAKGILKLNI